MSEKTMIMFGMIAGSFIGGYVPLLFGADSLGVASLLGSAAGAVLGVWIAYRLTR